MKSGRNDWRMEARAMLALAWPLILANLTTQVIQATDAVLLGRLGALELASAALALGLTFALTLFAFGILTASAPLMASALGARSNAVRDVRRTFRQAMWAAILMTVPIMAVLAFAEPIIVALGQERRLARGAASFLAGYMWTLPPWMAFQVMRNFLSALERPGWVLAISAAGIVVNALAGYGLIFGAFGLPAWGLFGGGLASAITWALMAIALAAVIVSDRQFRRFHLFGRFWRADWARFRAVFRLGLPIGLAMGFEGAVFSAAAYLMGLIGASSVAAHQVALQIAATTFMVPLGLAQAATVRVGLAYGRRDRDGVTRAGWTALAMGVAFMAAMALLMWVFPRPLVTLFFADTAANAGVIALAVSFLAVAALFQMVDGAQVVGAGMLRGLHDTRVPMMFALVGYWVVGIGTGLALGFGLDWRGVGIWAGLAVGLAFVAVLMIRRWTRREALGLVPDPA
jgi:MATE family multidrug resistance protein